MKHYRAASLYLMQYVPVERFLVSTYPDPAILYDFTNLPFISNKEITHGVLKPVLTRISCPFFTMLGNIFHFGSVVDISSWPLVTFVKTFVTVTLNTSVMQFKLSDTV